MVEHAVDIVDDLSGVVVGDLTRPACPDALGAVHQHHWNDRNVPLGLHLLVIIIQELEEVGIHRWEQELGEGTVKNRSIIMRHAQTNLYWQERLHTIAFMVALPEHSEDVTRTGSIFASIDASTKLTQGLQDVQVVTANEVLSQVHYGHHESLLQAQTEGPSLINCLHSQGACR